MIRINLLRETSTQRAAAWSPQKSQAGLYGLILLLVTFSTMGWYWYYLNNQLAAATIKRQELQQEKLQLQVVKAQFEKYEIQKKKLEHRIAVIERLKANQKGPVMLMNGVIASVPDKPTLWLNSLVQKDALVTIEGRSFDINSIADFIKNLNSRPPFKKVELGFLEHDQEDSIKFALNCELAR